MQGIFIIFLKIFLLLFILFLIGRTFYIFKPLKKRAFSIAFLFIFPLLYITQPSYTLYFIFSFYLLIVYFYIAYYYSKSIKKVFWKLIKENLIIAIKIRELFFMPDRTYFFLKYLKPYITISIFFLLFLIFFSYHHLFIINLLTFFTLTSILTGFTLSFFSTFFSLIIKPSNFNKRNYLNASPNPYDNFSLFLKRIIETHPLNAIIEESFFEENLQIGEFYLVYPIFFKAEHPSQNNFDAEQEILNVWHLIRWESALSKQTGSAASRWSSLYSLNIMTTERNTHSIHTPLIPIYSEEFFAALVSAKLPYFDPFNQPPFWSPYLIITSFLDWKEDEIKEERLNEIEEEE